MIWEPDAATPKERVMLPLSLVGACLRSGAIRWRLEATRSPSPRSSWFDRADRDGRPVLRVPQALRERAPGEAS
jgi:hypothetical protein